MFHKFINKYINVIIFIVSVFYFSWYSISNWEQLPYVIFDVNSLLGFMAVITAYLATMLLSSFAWHLLLLGTGVGGNLRDAITVLLLSQFAKYIPGNVAHHIGRVALARAYGFPAPEVLFTMALEIALVLAVACVLAIGGVVSLGASVLDALPAAPPVWQVILIGGGVAAAPFACLWLLNRYRPGPMRRLMGEKPISPPRPSLVLACCAIYVANYGLVGFALDLLAQSVFGAGESHVWALTGIFAIAWVAGFVTPGAPGGLGVREAIIASALTPFYGAGSAVALALALRLVTTAGDGLGFCAGLALRRWATVPRKG